MLQKLLFLALAGAAGTLARYGLGTLVDKYWTLGKLPTGILVVNTVGCFFYGLVTALADNQKIISPETKFYLLTGFAAAFTTFSSFLFLEEEFLMEDYFPVAGLHLLLHLSLGLIAVFVGLNIVKWLARLF
jgi:fluoride exporter